MEDSRFQKNLSRGNVAKQLMVFAWPFILSNLIQSFYNVADMIIVGQFAGTASMSGVNIGGQVTFLMTNIVIGLSVGGTVLIGQYLGRNEYKDMSETVSTMFTTLLMLAVVMTFVMLLIREPVLKLLNTPIESLSEARRYLVVTALGTIFIFSYNALSACMRGMGDSKHPMVFVTIACVTNIILDIVLVAGVGMGALGAAVATIFSQAVSVILCILYMIRNDFIFDFKLSSFKIAKDKLRMLLKVGIPTSVQNVITNISFLFVTAMGNSFGVAASAAIGAVGKFNGFAILPAIAISSAISAMSAQNIGAGEIDRAKKTMRTGLILAMSITWSIFILVQIFPKAVLSLFSSDAEMIRLGVDYIRVFSLDYLIIPICFCLNGVNIGSGHTIFSLINNCMSALLFRIPAAYLFGMVLGWGLKGLGLGAPVASVAAMIVAVWYYLSGKWQKPVVFK